MIDLHQTEPGQWIHFVTDPHTGTVIKIKIQSWEQDGKPSAEPSDELLAVVCNTASNACSIRDHMINAIHNSVSDPDYPERIAHTGILGSLNCDQDLMDFFAQTGLPTYQMTEERLANLDHSDLLHLKEIPKLVYLLIEQKKGCIWKHDNTPNELFTTGYLVDPWTCLWTAGAGYIDGPYSLQFPKNYQIQP